MKNIAIALFVLAIVIAVVSLFYVNQGNDLIVKTNNPGNLNITTHYVEIKDFSFSPEEIRIKKGERIVWTNNDSVKHTVTSDSGIELDSPSLEKGETYSHIFDKTGTFSYHCTFHSSMKARVIVE